MNFLQHFWFFIFIETCVLCNEDLNHYITDRSNFVNTLLKRVSRGAQRDVAFGEPHTFPLQLLEKDAHSFRLFNNTYFFIDYELFELIAVGDKFAPISNTKFKRFGDKIIFIKTIEYETMGIVFIAFESGMAKIYRHTPNSMERLYLQTMKNPNKITDADFFVNNGILCLVVTRMLGVSLAPLVIYTWKGTYFDQTASVFLEGAVKFTHFTQNSSEIIVALRNNGIEKSNSYVYEFKENTINKIQILESTTPKFGQIFDFDDRKFLAVFDYGAPSSFYWWDESQFVLVQNFEHAQDIEKMHVEHFDNYALIFIAQKGEILAYTVTSTEVKFSSSIALDQNYTSISILESVIYEEIPMLFIMAKDQHTLAYTIISYSVHQTEIVNLKVKTNLLMDCLNELNMLLSNNEQEFEKISKHKEKIIQTDEPLNFEGRMNVAAPVVAQKFNFNIDGANKLMDQATKIDNELNELNEALERIEPTLHFDNSDATVVIGKLVIQGGLHADKLNTNNMFLKKLNRVNWTPEQWLSHSKEQTVFAPMSVDELTIDELLFANEENMFRNVLLLDGNQTITGEVNANNLNATNVYTFEINDVLMEDLYLRSNPKKIEGKKTFRNAHVVDLHVDFLNGENASDIIKLFGDPKATRYEYAKNLEIQNLNVKRINNVDWDVFSESVFKIGENQVIKGDLKMVSFKTTELETEYISGIETDKLLTTSTDQTINSIMVFGNVNAKNVIANKTNGLNFGKDVAVFGENRTTVISGPVTIKKIHMGDFNRNSNDVDQANEFHTENHIVGTNESDLLQIYKNKVKITGNLYLESVHLPKLTKLFIKGNEFNQGNFNDYWLKTKYQEIPVHFEAQQGITMPHLNAKLLNNIPINNYMLNNLDDKPPTIYVFENATVHGNIILNGDAQHIPDLQKLETESVKLSGTHSIRGVKTFTRKLTVDNLKTDILNDELTADIIHKNSPEIRGKKILRELIVEKEVQVKQISTKKINGHDLNELQEQVVFIDTPAHFSNLDFYNITVDELNTTKVNNKLFNEYIMELDQIYVLKSLNRLVIKGSATLNNANGVSKINNINVVEKQEKASNDETINGNVTFDGRVHVKNLFVVNVNRINFSDLLPRLYYRYWPQNVTARHSFQIVKAKNIDAIRINNVTVNNLIDTKSNIPQIMNIEKRLILNNVKFLKSLYGDFDKCDVVQAVAAIRDIPTRFWESINILGNLTLLDDNAKLTNILNNGVCGNRKSTITAPVTFKNIHARNVTTEKLINGINLDEIIHDALMINTPNQVVTGFKEFLNMKADKAKIDGNIDLPIVNNINITKVDSSIIHKNKVHENVITGRKTFFGGIQAQRLLAKQVAGVVPENLVSTSNPRPIPLATFDSLEVVDDMNIGFVNNVNFDTFLNDRLLLNSNEIQVVTGVYFLEDVVLTGDSIIPSINNVIMDDVVFDEGIQLINSTKTFKENLIVQGNVYIEDVNGFYLTELYDNALLLDESATISGNTVFAAPSEIMGDIYAENINGVPFHQIKEMLISQNPQIRAEIVQDTIKSIEKLITDDVAIISKLPDQYLYLDKSEIMQINEFTNAVDVQVVHSKSGLWLHAKSEEPGIVCGLPEQCKCPNQYTMQITSGYSKNRIENKYAQRVFSYQNDEIMVHVITNSRSTSDICRMNDSILNETTTINWSRASTVDLTSKTFMYPHKLMGYISDVKFFTLKGIVYMVVAMFYNPQLKTHETECVVYRFTSNKDKIEEMQRIRTEAAWSLHVFYTAQGIHLVIGSKSFSDYHHRELSSSIYRFNRNEEKFYILRKLPSISCTSIASVVLEYDSLIILVVEKAPLMILRYDPDHDNFYMFQSFIFEFPVTSVSTFYTGGSGISDAYLIVVTDNGAFYLYSYQYLAGWKKDSEGEIDGLRALVPFTFNKIQYLLALSTDQSSLLEIVKHGYKMK